MIGSGRKNVHLQGVPVVDLTRLQCVVLSHSHIESFSRINGSVKGTLGEERNLRRMIRRDQKRRCVSQ